MAGLNLNKRLSGILAAARTVVSQLDLDKALAIVLKESMAVTDTKAGSIALYNAESHTLRIHAHKGFSRHFLANREWKVGRYGLTERIIRSKQMIVITNTESKSFFSLSLIHI